MPALTVFNAASMLLEELLRLLDEARNEFMAVLAHGLFTCSEEMLALSRESTRSILEDEFERKSEVV